MKYLPFWICLGWVVLLTACAHSPISTAPDVLRNDEFRRCVEGIPIYSQGGGIFRFPDPETGRERFFWYGVHYREAELYIEDPSRTYERCSFESVTCYVSDDLVNWESRGDALSREEILAHTFPYWVGRLGVARVDSVYALFVQCGSKVLVAESPSPLGEFKWARLLDMSELIGTSNTGDQTVFTDEDTGKSYLVCSKANGRNRLYIAEIGRTADGSIGLLDCTLVFAGPGREGNCMFKRGGKYYLCASNLYGWDCSYAYFLVADSVKGPYRQAIVDYQRPVNDHPARAAFDMQVMPGCEQDYAHLTQTGFFYTLKGTEGELVIYCGDRWADFAGNGLGYNPWVPLSFEGEVPQFNSLSSWCLDARRATWCVAPDNDYAKNGSFEADRRVIPQKEKPRQDFLTGWTTEVLYGNHPSVEDEASPRLNYEKTPEERIGTIGEKALMIADTVPFARRVSQEIASTPWVPLPDGVYRLCAKVKVSGELNDAYLYAVSDGRRYRTLKLSSPESGEWQEWSLNRVKVRGGRVQIGVFVEGEAGACCLVDDVEMRRRP